MDMAELHPVSRGARGDGVLDVANDPLDHRCLAFADDQVPTYVSEGLSARYAIRLANTHDHRRAASYLMRKLYEWRGYSTDIVREDPTGVTLVASEGDRISATVTVGFDSPKGMAVESLYPDEVAQLRREGARLCEFTRLAVDRAGHSMELLGMLFHVAYLYARRVHEASHLLAEVNPRHLRFYQRMLGFHIAGPRRVCQRVDAPAVMISLLLDHAEDQIALYGGHPELAQTKRSLYPFFFAPCDEEGIARRLFASEMRGHAFEQGRLLHA
jgi:hypothetical protein